MFVFDLGDCIVYQTVCAQPLLSTTRWTGHGLQKALHHATQRASVEERGILEYQSGLSSDLDIDLELEVGAAGGVRRP